MTGKKANLNKFAHPRNPYKSGLGDLDELAKEDPEFASLAKRKENGKVTTDWTDREYTRKLMKAVIKRDFQLDLESPVGSLAPALTNKLNYLLWIDDLAKLNNVQEVQGIDIGSGAAMYFAAIAVKHFQWSMLATESNQEDYKTALQNLKRNGLEGKLTLVKTDVKGEIFKIDGSFFFSLCNPPFYEVNEERREREDIEEPTGRNHEVATDGGEIEFVSKMIEESRQIQDKVKFFSSLIGHKRNVAVLKETLKNIPEVRSSTVTELCQGRTMRWVLAWTYHPDIKLELPTPRSEFKSQEKQGKPIIFEVSTPSTCQEISTVLKTYLSDINVQVAKEGKRDDTSCYLRLKTTKTDWRGQRAKRRMLEKGPQTKRMKLDSDEDMEVEESVKLDCQLYLNKKEDKVAFQFVFLNGEVGKGGMSELVQCLKRNFNICA